MFTWHRTPRTFTIDPDDPPVVGSQAQVSAPLFGYVDDFEFIARKSYNVATSVPAYRWRFEDYLIGGVGVNAGFTRLIEVTFTRTYDQGSIIRETVENRFGQAFYNPETEELEDETFQDWEVYSVRNFPQDGMPSTQFTLNPPTVDVAGTYELYVRLFEDGEEQGEPEFAGKYDMRDLEIENLRTTHPFDPLEGPGEIEFDVIAYPIPSADAVFQNGWTPSSPIEWSLEAEKIWFHDEVLADSGYEATLTGAPESDGRVAHVAIPWSGVTPEGEFLADDAVVLVFVLADSPGPGNIRSLGARPVSVYHRACPCEGWQSQANLNFSVPMFGSGPLQSLNLSYSSLNFWRGPGSLGHGWSSQGSDRISEPDSDAIVLRSASGIVRRWHDDGNGNYLPVREDNFAEVVKDTGSNDARFVVRFQDQTVQEFQADGRLKRELDRHGNSLTYAYSGYQLSSITDSRGHVLHYSYGSRTDGQPTEIRSGSSPHERVIQFEYFPDTDPVSPDRLRSITDPEGQVVEFAYDLRGRLTNTTTLRPTRGDLEVSYQYDDTDRLYLESIHGLLYRTHDRSETITVGGPRTLITTIPFDPNGAPLHDEERNEHFVRRQFGRISQHHINYNLELPT